MFRPLQILASVTILLLLTGCASSQHTAAGPPRAVLHLTAQVTGDQNLIQHSAIQEAGSTFLSWRPTCAELARTGTGLPAPSPLAVFAVATAPSFVSASPALAYGGITVHSYHGPGTYQTSALKVPELFVVQGVGFPDRVDYLWTPASRATLSIGADSGGHASVSNLSTTSGHTASLLLTWTCSPN